MTPDLRRKLTSAAARAEQAVDERNRLIVEPQAGGAFLRHIAALVSPSGVDRIVKRAVVTS